MEQQHRKDGQFIVLAKGNWKIADNTGDYVLRDDNAMGTVDVQILKWCDKAVNGDLERSKLSNNAAILIDKFAVDVFPGSSPTGASAFHIPDYLGAVTSNMFCFVYATQNFRSQYKYQFVVYNIDEANKKVSVKTQFVIDIKRPPTAMIAIKDKVFLGFPGQVGYVDLAKPTLSLNLFHTWLVESYGKNFSKTIDAFAYDSTIPDSELIAIDDMVRPKYAFEYKVNRSEPKYVAKFDLPTGVNENYRHAIKSGNRMTLTAYRYSQGGEGNNIVVFDGTRAVMTLEEMCPWEGNYRLLIAGTEYTQLSSLGLLDNNIILVTAGTRGVIAIPIDQIRLEEQLMYGYEERQVRVPYGVKNVHIGTSASELVTVKEKSTAFVLGTADDKHSVLSQLKWNSTTNDLEVVCSHHIEGSYDRLFMEV